MAPVRPSVHSWEVSRAWSWEEHSKTVAIRDGFYAKGVFWLNSQDTMKS